MEPNKWEKVAAFFIEAIFDLMQLVYVLFMVALVGALAFSSFYLGVECSTHAECMAFIGGVLDG